VQIERRNFRVFRGWIAQGRRFEIDCFNRYVTAFLDDEGIAEIKGWIAPCTGPDWDATAETTQSRSDYRGDRSE